MKCLLCPNEIDETREVHAEDVHSQKKHSAALAEWSQITAYIGNRQILTGHVCPDEQTQPLKLVRADEKKVGK